MIPADRDSCIHRMFERIARERPDALAVVCGDQLVPYRDLESRANFLARHLQQSGVRRGDMVALILPRSVEMVIAMLAVLKAGGAYLPLEACNPQARNLLYLKTAEVRHIIASPDSDPALLEGRAVTSTADRSLFAGELPDFASVPSSRDDRCYAMFTSGSTGEPKGVVVPHRAVVRLVVNTNYIQIAPEDTVLQLSPPSFDASTFEFWGPLLNGATLALYTGTTLDPSLLRAELATYGVTIMWLTAALFHLVVTRCPDVLRPLRVLLAGGDVLNPKHVNRILEELPHLTLINGYGPTENTTFTCCHVMTAENRPTDAVPIGRAITGTRLHILDDQREPVERGRVGELYTSGDGVALGYLGSADPTASFFIDERLAPGPIYRTGDLVRECADGTLDFMGRQDAQVKIRGYRVSLEEIRLRVVELPGVSDAVVVRKVLDSGDQLLIAYVQLEREATLEARDIRRQLASTLPRYMVPDRFVLDTALPITGTGKLDRRLLLAASVPP